MTTYLHSTPPSNMPNPGLSGMRSDRAFATVFKGTRWWLPMLAFFWLPCASGVSLSDPTLPHPAWLVIHPIPPEAENLMPQGASSKARLTIVGMSRKFAIINGKLVKPGDNYKGSKVLDIKAGEVVMRDKSKSLQVNPLINKKPVSHAR